MQQNAQTSMYLHHHRKFASVMFRYAMVWETIIPPSCSMHWWVWKKDIPSSCSMHWWVWEKDIPHSWSDMLGIWISDILVPHQRVHVKDTPILSLNTTQSCMHHTTSVGCRIVEQYVLVNIEHKTTNSSTVRSSLPICFLFWTQSNNANKVEHRERL